MDEQLGEAAQAKGRGFRERGLGSRGAPGGPCPAVAAVPRSVRRGARGCGHIHGPADPEVDPECCRC